jgi:hypothetical protein
MIFLANILELSMYQHSRCGCVDDLRFRDVIDITESAAWRNNEVIRLELCSVLDFLAAGSGKAQHWMPPGIWVAPLMILVPGLLYVPF